MADDGFNGATLLNGTVSLGPLRSIQSNEVTAAVAVSGSGDAEKSFANGLPEKTTTFVIVGGTTLSVKDAVALNVAWNDIGSATDGTIAVGTVMSIGMAGSVDSEILTTIEVKKAAATA